MLRQRSFYTNHQPSADAILPPGTPDHRKVFSRGSMFFNMDKWPLIHFQIHMLKWAKANKGKTPSVVDIHIWVREANACKMGEGHAKKDGEDSPDFKPYIQVAATPLDVNQRTFMAIIGGVYHECWHTKYSRRISLNPDEMVREVQNRWGQIKNWGQYGSFIMSMSNIVEDIRIERLGIKDYPGTIVKMQDLQDFIIALETKGANAAKAAGHVPSLASPLGVVSSVFRDAGLNYATEEGMAAMARYKAWQPAAYDLTLRGPIRPLLDQAQGLTRKQDTQCLWIAMDVVIELHKAAIAPPQPKPEDEKGKNKKKGKKQDGEKGQGAPSPSQGGSGDSADGDDQTSQGSSGEGKKQKGKGPSATKKGDDSKGGSEGEKEGAGAEGQGKEEGDGGKGGDSKGSGRGDAKEWEYEEGDDDKRADPMGEGTLSVGSGGHYNDLSEHQGNYNDVALSVLQDARRDGEMVKGWTEALSTAVHDAWSQVEAGVDYGCKPWRPYTTEHDVENLVSSSSRGRASDDAATANLLTSVRQECTVLRTKLRQMVREAEMVGTEHGVRKGKRLSPRHLTNTVITMRGGRAPQHAYQQSDEAVDTSMAAAIVVDESGSMAGRLRLTSQGLVALVEPLDKLGVATQVVGFRNGNGYDAVSGKEAYQYHRDTGITYDIFKRFDERFTNVRYRFNNLRAVGGTPMADGIAHAMASMNGRTEGHRVIFVLTDGAPDYSHKPVIRWQIEQCRNAGIHLVGVGLGPGAQYVTTLFDDSVYASDLRMLPAALTKKLNELLNFRHRREGVNQKRGKRVTVRG